MTPTPMVMTPFLRISSSVSARAGMVAAAATAADADARNRRRLNMARLLMSLSLLLKAARSVAGLLWLVAPTAVARRRNGMQAADPRVGRPVCGHRPTAASVTCDHTACDAIGWKKWLSSRLQPDASIPFGRWCGRGRASDGLMNAEVA